MKQLFIPFFLSFLCVQIYGQIQFRQQDDLVDLQDFNSGTPVAVIDFNGDGRDDIVRMDKARDIRIEIQTTGTDPFYRFGSIRAGSAEQWHIVVGDLNNDGAQDIMTGGVYDNLKIISAPPFTNDFSIANIPTLPLYAQGANFVDVNNDGWLDAFVCDDDAANRIFINDGTGRLLPSTDYDLTTDPPSDNSGNYGSIWSDFDDDGDLDCYVAKCRAGVTDPADPRRINMLFLNNGENQFEEEAATYGLADGNQSWSPDFNDYDNDGDMDLFITNHEVTGNDGPSVLLENIENDTFVDVTAGSGIDLGNSVAIQGVFRDFDNDGFQDLFVAGSEHFMFRNNGDGTFTEQPGALPGLAIASYGIGDLNHDGFLDVYAVYPELFNNPSNIDDKLFLNIPNANHYVKFQLEGTSSNRSAVGAKLELYGQWGIQVREVRAGESYGIVNSLIQHFGLGRDTLIDSLIVKWPDGRLDKFNNLRADTQYLIEQGGSISQGVDIGGPYILCEGDSVTLTAPEEFHAYQWSNGSTERSITVSDAGVYFVRMRDQVNLLYRSLPVAVLKDVDPARIEIDILGDSVLCSGDIVTLQVPEYAAYTWSTGDTTRTVAVDTDGQYSVVVQGACETIPSDTVGLRFVDSGTLVASGDSIEPGETALLIATGGDSISWYLSDTARVPIATGPEYLTPPLDSSQVYYVSNTVVEPGKGFRTGMPAHAGPTFYNADNFNGSIIFNVGRRFRLDSVTVFTDFPGERTVRIRDAANTTLWEGTFAIDSGRTRLPILYWFEPGTRYQMTTNTEKNMEIFGVLSPKLWRAESGVGYPYTVGDVVSLRNSNFGIEYYYYFFDWKISTEDLVCHSERQPVLAFVDMGTGFNGPGLFSDISVYPNPANTFLHLDLRDAARIGTYQVSLLSVSGEVLWMQSPDLTGLYRIQVDQYPPGVYFLKVTSGHESSTRKIVLY